MDFFEDGLFLRRSNFNGDFSDETARCFGEGSLADNGKLGSGLPIVQAYFDVQVLLSPFSGPTVRAKEYVESPPAYLRTAVQHGNRPSAAISRNRHHRSKFQQTSVGRYKHRAVRVDVFSTCCHAVAELSTAFPARTVGGHQHPDRSRRRAGGLDFDSWRRHSPGRDRRRQRDRGRQGHFRPANNRRLRCDRRRHGLDFRFRRQLGDVARFRRGSLPRDQGRRTTQEQRQDYRASDWILHRCFLSSATALGGTLAVTSRLLRPYRAIHFGPRVVSCIPAASVRPERYPGLGSVGSFQHENQEERGFYGRRIVGQGISQKKSPL